MTKASFPAGFKQGPDDDSFFAPPGGLPDRDGAAIWVRRHTGPDALRSGSRSDVILYTSTSLDGRRIAVSGSLTLPPGDVPVGGWPLISYSHTTVGVADAAAPTRTSDFGELGNAYPLLDRWLQEGFAIVRTDYAGLGTSSFGGHGYVIGTPLGRSVIDAARAAFELAGAVLSGRVLFAGHSQGGAATLFAAALASSWAPELDVVAAVDMAGPSFLPDQLSLLAGILRPEAYGYDIAAVFGIGLRGADNIWPHLNVTGMLSDKGRESWPAIGSLPYTPLLALLSGTAPGQLLKPGADIAELISHFARESAEILHFDTPLLVVQGEDDPSVPKAYTDRLVDTYRRAGMAVTYNTYPGVDHEGILSGPAASDTTTYLHKAFG